MSKKIITIEFLDKVLTVDVLKKYRKYKNDHYLVQEHIDWAHDNLIGYTRYQAMYLMVKKHNEYMKLGSPWTKRNEFVKVMHCIDYELGHDFKKGQEVTYWCLPRGTRRSIIEEVLDRNRVIIDDTIMSIDLIIHDEPLPITGDEIGQLSLF